MPHCDAPLDLPIWQRYFIWLGTADGDPAPGRQRPPVTPADAPQTLNSAFLVLVSVVMIPLALGLALLRRAPGEGGRQRHLRPTLSLAGVPEFVTGILLVAIFHQRVKILPAVTVLPIGKALNRPLSLILPVLTLVFAVTPYRPGFCDPRCSRL